jgi:hypothetical protein
VVVVGDVVGVGGFNMELIAFMGDLSVFTGNYFWLAPNYYNCYIWVCGHFCYSYHKLQIYN